MAFFDIESDELEAMMEESEADVAEYKGCKTQENKPESLGRTWYA